MKDAFGGTYMLRILIIFFVIYISFMTVAIGFARAFRVKNNVINIIEDPTYRNEEITSDNDNSKLLTAINVYLDKISYNYSSNTDSNTDIKKKCTTNGGNYVSRGICVKKMESNNKYYYEVTSYYLLESPLFGFELIVPITGETKIINL